LILILNILIIAKNAEIIKQKNEVKHQDYKALALMGKTLVLQT